MSSVISLQTDRQAEFLEEKPKPSISPLADVGKLPRLTAQEALSLGRRQAIWDFYSSLPLLVVDVIAVVTAVGFARIVSALLGESTIFANLWFDVGLVLLTLLFHRIHGLYPGCGLTHSIEYRRILRTCLMVSAAVVVGSLMRAESATIAWVELSALMLSLSLFATSFRSLARCGLSKFDWWVQPVAIIGGGPEASRIYNRLAKCRFEGLRPVGFVYEPSEHWDSDAVPSATYLGPITELGTILSETGTCRVAVAEQDNFCWQEYHGFHGFRT